MSSTNDHVRPCNSKPQQRDLTPVWRRPVEPATAKRTCRRHVKTDAIGPGTDITSINLTKFDELFCRACNAPWRDVALQAFVSKDF
jgi:hypothetical protein